MPYYQSVGDFPVNVMMNQFDVSNWDDNDDSDLYESIDLIEDYYDIMTDMLRHQILEASPHARTRRQFGIFKKVEQNQCLSCYRILFHYQIYLAMPITVGVVGLL
jgi:hypothetical protein